MAEPGDPKRKRRSREKIWFCPSAQPSLEGSVILGVVQSVEGAEHVAFLKRPGKVTEGTILAFTGSQQRSTEVFRFAAPCQKQDCKNWSGNGCRVAERLVQILPEASHQLPPCRLRSVCLWFEQEGGAACMRCTQVLTDNEAMELTLNPGPPAPAAAESVATPQEPLATRECLP